MKCIVVDVHSACVLNTMYCWQIVVYVCAELYPYMKHYAVHEVSCWFCFNSVHCQCSAVSSTVLSAVLCE